ncbi:MAG: hypothetical protein JNL52_08020 [Flavobacteriales bacterium]|nr:hypothetical protein [Flavobacteriales bacterium]
MEKRVHLTFEAALLVALFALFGLSLFASPTGAVVKDEILITGRLLAEDRHMDDAVLVVELEGDRCLFAELYDNGQFFFRLPVGAKATLLFMKPGHLPKEVTVDTRNALNTPKAVKENRKVKFEVVLESEEQRPGRRYDGPVGSIRFVNGSGTMKVMHDLRVVADDAL